LATIQLIEQTLKQHLLGVGVSAQIPARSWIVEGVGVREPAQPAVLASRVRGIGDQQMDLVGRVMGD
jgi:hypothetical protein